jgi:hypothetical protein
MENQSEQKLTTRRPIAVWIALGILLLYVPIFLLGIFSSSDRKSVSGEREFSDVVVYAILWASVIISLVIAFWAIAVRKQWGRWFVAAHIAYITGFLIWGHLTVPELVAEDSYDRTKILLGAIIWFSPLLIVILLVSFGANVKQYFSSSVASGDAD